MPRVFIDGGKWYPWAPKRLGFDRHNVAHFGPRSAIERLFGDIEWRARRFWNKFKDAYGRESIE